jgi:hypothetical protein
MPDAWKLFRRMKRAFVYSVFRSVIDNKVLEEAGKSI